MTNEEPLGDDDMTTSPSGAPQEGLGGGTPTAPTATRRRDGTDGGRPTDGTDGGRRRRHATADGRRRHGRRTDADGTDGDATDSTDGDAS